MKTLISKKITGLMVFTGIFLGSCSDLNEEIFGSISPENYYQTEEEAISSLVGVYQRTLNLLNPSSPNYRIQIQGTDEFIVPTLNTGGWYEGGRNDEFILHKFTPGNKTINVTWKNCFAVIGAANAVMEAFENSPQAGKLKGPIAEVRALRAYAYFFAMDFFGNVPIFTEARVDPSNLPSTNSRKQVFEFVVDELKLAAKDLPSINDVNRADYFPRYTKETAWSILAITYLNGEVFAGEAYWDEAIEMSNNVINSGGYVLEEDISTNFIEDNHISREIIAAASLDPQQNAWGTNAIARILHPMHQVKFNLPFEPWNGFKAHQTAIERYEEDDLRQQFLLYGPQFDSEGNPLPEEKGSDKQLNLVPIKDFRSVAHNEGARVLKFLPDADYVGTLSGHDLVFIRYAEIIMTKAEALFRKGNTGDALELVNQVRRRSNATELTSLTLQDIEDERAREFIWEGQRRRDMIRFGSYFTGTWEFKTEVTPEYVGLYPIPTKQLDGNPNLKQNPGY